MLVPLLASFKSTSVDNRFVGCTYRCGRHTTRQSNIHEIRWVPCARPNRRMDLVPRTKAQTFAEVILRYLYLIARLWSFVFQDYLSALQVVYVHKKRLTTSEHLSNTVDTPISCRWSLCLVLRTVGERAISTHYTSFVVPVGSAVSDPHSKTWRSFTPSTQERKECSTDIESNRGPPPHCRRQQEIRRPLLCKDFINKYQGINYSCFGLRKRRRSRAFPSVDCTQECPRGTRRPFLQSAMVLASP